MAPLYTIGFTKKSARDFFSLLSLNRVKQILDVRLNPNTQLAGFTKKSDFGYFLEMLCNCNYRHLLQLAPTKELLDNYHQKKINWFEYQTEFKRLIEERKIRDLVKREELEYRCLLCAEPTAEKCHRRLVAEYFQRIYADLEIKHL
jgi:uncharacterized protein (DUF488 family)